MDRTFLSDQLPNPYTEADADWWLGMMTEKMRSLLSRTQPRDYYDLWYLSEKEGMEMADHRYEFEVKTRHKGLDPDSLQEKLQGKVAVFK